LTVRWFELYQVGELESWERAARGWLASPRGCERVEDQVDAARLLPSMPAFLQTWPAAFAAIRDSKPIAHILDQYHIVVERILSLPRTPDSWQFYAVKRARLRHARLSVDWELAAGGRG